MILFVNFAPLQYMGGAERKIYELYSAVMQNERAVVMTASSHLANLYGTMVLGENFNDRSKGKLALNSRNSVSVGLKSFIPFTSEWYEVRRLMRDARLIYIKCDINEIIILMYFGGLNIFKKSIAGIRSPWLYPEPIKILEKLHNYIHASRVMRYLLHVVKKIHVLNFRAKIFFENEFRLNNVELIPNYTKVANQSHVEKSSINKKEFKLIFIGELLDRKGISILLDVIRNSPKEYKFDIVGDGPMKKEVISHTRIYPNCKYYGYLENKSLLTLLSKNDVLFFPSRAEGFGAVILEAMSVGLKVVDSPNIYLNLPSNIEFAPRISVASEYLRIFKKIYEEKKAGINDREEIKSFCANHFDTNIIMPVLLEKLFEIRVNK